MKFINKAQKYSIYLFLFSLNFETINLFNLGIDYLASKISICILLIFSLLNYKSLFSIKYFSKYIIPLLIYFLLLTYQSFTYRSLLYSTFFDFPFFLNILIFIVLINYTRIKSEILLNGLFVFALSTFLLSILYFFGIGLTDSSEGRITVFGINQNLLGLKTGLSLLIFISIIFENRLRFGKIRYWILLTFPFLFIIMIGSGSRVSFISFFLGLFMFIYFYKSIKFINKLLILLTAIFIFILFWQFFLKNSIVAERLYTSVNEGILSSRDMIWIKLYDIIFNNFILGVGKTGYANMVDYQFGGVLSPHNVILEVLCYTGIIGLTLFLNFFLKIVSFAIKRKRDREELLPIIVIIPILGMIITGQIFDQKIVWVLFAYILSYSSTTKKTIKGKI